MRVENQTVSTREETRPCLCALEAIVHDHERTLSGTETSDASQHVVDLEVADNSIREQQNLYLNTQKETYNSEIWFFPMSATRGSLMTLNKGIKLWYSGWGDELGDGTNVVQCSLSIRVAHERN